MFGFSKKMSFGLDLSDLSLKIIQLKRKGKGLSLVGSLKEDIPAGLIQGGEIKQEEKLVTILRGALKKIGGEFSSNRQVVCNLPEEKVFVRVIRLPLMKKEELAQAVYWEAEAHIPLSIDEVYLDWQLIEPISRQADHYDTLIAAAPRFLVDSYLKFFRKSGLEPIVLEPESVAIVRALIKTDTSESTIIVDLGVSGTNFVIFSDSAIYFSSHVAISGRLFNQVIMKNLKVSEKKANQLKIKIGLDKTKERGKVYRALEPLADSLSKQIKDYIDFYHRHSSYLRRPDGVIDQVLLCGGDSLLLNLPSFLSQKLNLPVKLGNPLVNIGKLSLSRKEALTWSTALGLALRNLEHD